MTGITVSFKPSIDTKLCSSRRTSPFHLQSQPSFRASSVCPDMVLGRIHNPAEGYYSTASMLLNYASGKSESLEALFPAPSVSVNVDDTGTYKYVKEEKHLISGRLSILEAVNRSFSHVSLSLLPSLLSSLCSQTSRRSSS